MSIKQIRETIRRIEDTISGWSHVSQASEIERDMVLEQLRGLYAAVKYPGIAALDMSPAEQPPAAPPVTPPATIEEVSPAPSQVLRRDGIDRTAILSLYGDSEQEETPDAGQVAEYEPEPEPEPVGAPSHKILGEVMGSPVRLGDALGKGANPMDVASIVASSRTVSLRQSLGVNDRFMVISSLFGDDADACERVIDELDAFGDLDEALLHIYDNYAWDPDNQGVKILVDLLTRKLS
jgi:hypothetical protein